MTTETKVYLTTAELAQRWAMSEQALRNWRFKGLGPRYFKPSGARGPALYKVEDVIAWENSRTVEHTEGEVR